MQKIFFLGLVLMVAVMNITLPANADRGRHAAKYGGHGGYHGYKGHSGHGGYHRHKGHGGYRDHGGGHIGIGVYLGPRWWGPAWQAPYPYYPYYPVPIVVQKPSTEIFVQQPPQAEESYYWYYCRESQGYYPDVDKCPGGWLKVVPPDSPPQ